MYTKPKIGDFVRDEDSLVRGFVIGEGTIAYGSSPIPAYRVKTASQVELIPKDQTVIINRDGFTWRDWLRLYRAGRVKV